MVSKGNLSCRVSRKREDELGPRLRTLTTWLKNRSDELRKNGVQSRTKKELVP